MNTPDPPAEASNPHVFRLWEELGTGLMEVECEAPDCGWKATFNPPISAEMKSQALRFQREHRLSFELEAAQARLDAIEKRHQPTTIPERRDLVCTGKHGAWQHWPCADARALGLGEEGDEA